MPDKSVLNLKLFWGEGNLCSKLNILFKIDFLFWDKTDGNLEQRMIQPGNKLAQHYFLKQDR